MFNKKSSVKNNNMCLIPSILASETPLFKRFVSKKQKQLSIIGQFGIENPVETMGETSRKTERLVDRKEFTLCLERCERVIYF